MKNSRIKNSSKWKRWHKWIGLIIAPFLFVICLSGITMNHRNAISGIDIPRSILPKSYHFNSWNNVAAKATLKLNKDSILLFGASGIWLTDSINVSYQDFSQGLKKGADNRIVSNVVRTDFGNMFAATTYDLYIYNNKSLAWQNISDRVGCHERLTDIAVKGDSVVVVSRSNLYISLPPYTHFEKKELPAPQNYVEEVSLFRTIWLLHSGEIYGLVGKLIIDAMALVILVLSVTGFIITFYHKLIKKKKKQGLAVDVSTLKNSYKLHNKLGWWLFPILIFIGGTGILLRPPLLITIIQMRVPPLCGSVIDSENPWNDRLRALCYDKYNDNWLLYSSEGFYSFDSLSETPVKEEEPPTVSVMGVTLLQQQDKENWMVASFSGAFLWNRESKEMIDCFTGKVVLPKKGGMPTLDKAISGYTKDLRGVKTLFSYDKEMFEMLNDKNTQPIAPMPKEIGKGRMSLWLFALECHVGRIYSPIIGELNMIFVFVSGAFFLVLSISGFIIYKRKYKKRY